MPRLCHPDDFLRMGAYFGKLPLLEPDEIATFEYRIRHRDGHWVWLLSQDTVFERAADNSVLRHIGVATDISAQKRAEAVALSQAKAAHAASEELRTFAYSVSHDMKSPSNTLGMLLEEISLTQGDALDADGRKLLELGISTVSRMQALIEDLLDYTRIIGEAMKPDRVALGQIVEQVLKDLHADIAQSGAQIEVGTLPDIKGSATHIRLLMQNLISNAIKFCQPDTAPQVFVTETTGAADTMISVAVTDHGIGIPEALQDRIFGMFKRLHLAETYPGTGLGLAICKRVAVAQGGEISVTSSEGKGATFTVTFERP